MEPSAVVKWTLCCLLLVILNLMEGCLPKSHGVFYLAVPESDGLVFREESSKTHLTTLEDCSTQCFQTSGCYSFTFVSHMCYLYATGYPFLLDSFSSQTAKTFRASNEMQITNCDNGFSVDSSGTVCYKFMEAHTEKMNWTNAMTKCSEMNSHLVTIETHWKLQILRDLVQLSGSRRTKSWWVGGYDISGRNELYKWINGHQVDSTMWLPNEPNLISEKCMQAKPPNLGLNDKECYALLNFICERRIG